MYEGRRGREPVETIKWSKPTSRSRVRSKVDDDDLSAVEVDLLYLVAGVHLDVPLCKLLGCPHDQLVETLDQPPEVIGLSAGRVADVPPPLEGDDFQIRDQTAGLAGGRHPGGIAADYDQSGP